MERETPKYCWNCGFLYAFTSLGETAKDCIFDPEAIRDEAEFPIIERLIESGKRDELLGRPVTAMIYNKRHGTPGKYTWLCCDGFHCLKGMFAPYDLITGPGYRTANDFEKIYQCLPGLMSIVKATEGESCPHYFAYRRGFSARDHVDLQLEDIRMRREEAFQQMALNIQSAFQSQSIQQQRINNLITGGSLTVAILSLIATIILALQR